MQMFHHLSLIVVFSACLTNGVTPDPCINWDIPWADSKEEKLVRRLLCVGGGGSIGGSTGGSAPAPAPVPVPVSQPAAEPINCDFRDRYPVPSSEWMVECCVGSKAYTAECGYHNGVYLFAHNDPMADQIIEDEPEYEAVSGTPEDSVWAVQISGKDLVIMALCAINVVMLAVLCCSCSRFGGASYRRKYAVVEVAGDSEMEHFQQ